VLNDLGKTVFELPPIQMPKERKQAAGLWAVSTFLDNNTEAFIQLHGAEKTKEILCENARTVGRELGEKIVESDPGLHDNLEKMARLILAMQYSFGQKNNFTMISNTEASCDITDCSQQVWCGEVCKQYEALFQGILSGVNPDYQLVYDKMITCGDKACHWSIMKKSSSNQVDSPLTVLKMRFARGEISKEQYLEMKALIE
jgi:hypothetical protein